MNYRPYIWLGEEADCHVIDYRTREAEIEHCEAQRNYSRIYLSAYANRNFMTATELQRVNVQLASLRPFTEKPKSNFLNNLIYGSIGAWGRF